MLKNSPDTIRSLLTSLALVACGSLPIAGCTQVAVSEQPTDNQRSGQDQVAQNDPADGTRPASGSLPGKDKTDEQDAEAGLQHPFAQRSRAPEFPKDLHWINTAGPLRMRDLRGKFVLLDFWTYCCINCIHILPELKKLEKAYPNELVVIGVHSAKFETEKDAQNIEEAVLRYEIVHPVVNDAEHRIWQSFFVRSWPSLRLIDPEGNLVAGDSGEFQFEQLDAFMKHALPYYRQKGLLDETPIRFDLLAERQKKTPLRFPGKVLADPKGDRLFIADSNHNRIVISSLEGNLRETIGSGAIGRADGDYRTATFDHPQGMALNGNTLYVADTENHLLRKIDLTAKTVETIAGRGYQGRSAWPGYNQAEGSTGKRFVGEPMETALNSPWALWVHKDDLYIAMAGPHQIWKMTLDGSEIGPYAGNGREDIVDGPLLPPEPYAMGASSFAQPSGLTSDGQWLFVADSEGSSIRAVPFDRTKEVRTVVGTSQLPGGRLFAFGDVDGRQPLVTYARGEGGNTDPLNPKLQGVRLQHALGVVYHDDKIFVADTYNNKIKVINAQTGETHTLAGTGKPGADDDTGTFDEPAGISYADGKLFVADTNNHLIRTVHPDTGQVTTLRIAGLTSPAAPATPHRPDFAGAQQVEMEAVQVQSVAGTIKMNVQLSIPDGWKINPHAPMGYYVQSLQESGPIDRAALPAKRIPLNQPSQSFEISLPVTGQGKDRLKISMNYFYCQQDGQGLCKVGSVVWTVPVNILDQANATVLTLRH